MGRGDKGYCKTTFSDSNNSSKSSNISYLAAFINDPDSREIVESSAEGTGKRGTNGGFIGVGEPKAPSIHCGFCDVFRVSIYGSCKRD